MSTIVRQCRTDGGCMIAVVRYPAGTYQAPHAHDVTTISLVLRGALEERVDGRSACAGVLDFVVKPRGTKHEDHYLTTDTTLLQVTPAGETIRQALDLGCPLDRWRWRNGTATARALVALAGLTADRTVVAEVEPAVDEVLASLGTVPGARRPGPPPPWLRRVRAVLDDACESGDAPPSVAELARDAGVHRVHLSREFRLHFGASPTEYRQRARLRAAVCRVAAPAPSLSRAAFDSGFADQAHMTREFRRRLGLTPLAYRRLVPRVGRRG